MHPGRTQSHRLFVAVPLPDNVRAFALHAQSLLHGTGDLRMIEEAQMHCTLAFVGLSDQRRTEEAKRVIAALPAACGGEVVAAGYLLLPKPRHARVVAIGVEDEQGLFAGLFETVMCCLEAAGVMQREPKPLRPHITIARQRTAGLVQPTADCGRAVFGVESVCLYESELRHDGAVHTVMVKRDLQRAYGQKMA